MRRVGRSGDAKKRNAVCEEERNRSRREKREEKESEDEAQRRVNQSCRGACVVDVVVLVYGQSAGSWPSLLGSRQMRPV